MKKFILIPILLLFLLNCSKPIVNLKGEETMIQPDNPNINYYGRIDFSNPKEPRFDWPGIVIEANFEGTSISAVFDDKENNYNVFIDGKLHKIIETKKGIHTYEIAKDLKNKPHTILITKRTEGGYGIAKFLGFILDKGKNLLPPPKRPKYKIEFIGDSLTCGYGNEGTTKQCSEADLRATENNYLAFGPSVARKLNAEYHIIAISGKGMVRNYGDKEKSSKDPLPSFYEYTLQNDSSKKWDFKKWVPDVVVINLGSNDFSTEPLADNRNYTETYKNFIKKVKNYYPDAKIFCACGPFVLDILEPLVKEVCEAEKVNFVKLPELTEEEKNGCNWHPTVKGHEKMAKPILKELKKILK